MREEPCAGAASCFKHGAEAVGKVAFNGPVGIGEVVMNADVGQNRVLDALLAADACFSLKDLAVKGNDLLTLGLRGRAVGAALQACLDAVIDEVVPNNRAALLAYAAENLQRFANS